MTDAERWRAIPSFPNYEASDLGRIRRAPGARGYGCMPGKIRRTWISSSTGYAMVVLYRAPERPAWRTVHSVIALAWLGPCPPGQEILHRDGNRANAALSNLFYGTRSQNHKQAYRDGRAVKGAAAVPGPNRPNAKLTAAQVHAIRATYQRGDAPALAREYDVSKGLILHIVHRRAWKHLDTEESSAPTRTQPETQSR